MERGRGMTFSGLWLPIVTPFSGGEVDGASYERLVQHYVEAGLAGLTPLGTTGESPTVDGAEADELIERTAATGAFSPPPTSRPPGSCTCTRAWPPTTTSAPARRGGSSSRSSRGSS